MLNRRSFIAGLFAAAVVPAVKAADVLALCYRHELIAQGVDTKRIKICWCRVNGEAHCICLVDDLYVIDTTLMSSVREIHRRPDITNLRQYAGLDEPGLVYAIAHSIPVATN